MLEKTEWTIQRNTRWRQKQKKQQKQKTKKTSNTDPSKTWGGATNILLVHTCIIENGDIIFATGNTSPKMGTCILSGCGGPIKYTSCHGDRTWLNVSCLENIKVIAHKRQLATVLMSCSLLVLIVGVTNILVKDHLISKTINQSIYCKAWILLLILVAYVFDRTKWLYLTIFLFHLWKHSFSVMLFWFGCYLILVGTNEDSYNLDKQKKIYGNQYQEVLENRYSHEPNLFL